MSAKILIIDDETSARQTLETQLFPEGYALQFAANGVDGLAQAHAWQPDVILCDVMMPGIDGFEFCRRIRADADLGQVPIILITALDDRQAKLNGLQAGADDFISKPIDTYELRARLRTLTTLDRFRKLNEERLKLEKTHRDLLQAHEALRASETRFRELIETSPDAVFVVDQETGQFVATNPAASQMYGYTQEEFLQMRSSDVSAEPQKTAAAIRDKVPFVPERIHRRKDGTTFPVEITGSYFAAQGRKLHTVFIRDITERKRAEQKIERRNLELRSLQATILDIASSHTLPDLLHLIVERACNLLNTSTGGLYLCDNERQEARCVVSYHTPRDYTGILLKYGEGAAGRVAQTGQALIIDDYQVWSGRAVIFEADKPFERVMSVPMKWQGLVTGVIHALRTGGPPFNHDDLELMGLFANHASLAVEQARLREALESELVEQKRLDDALRKSEARAQAMLNAIPDIMFRLSREGIFLDYRGDARSLYDQSENLIGKQVKDSLPLELARQTETMIAATLNTGLLHTFEYHLDIPGIGRREYEARMTPSGVDEVLTIVRDITERKQAETQLRESEERFRSFIEQSTDGFMLSDEQGMIIEWNHALEQITGLKRDDVAGMTVWDLQFQIATAEMRVKVSLESVKQAILRTLQSGRSLWFGLANEAEIQTAEGERKFIQQTSFPIRTTQGYRLGAVVRDITAFKAIEQQLRENEEKYHSIVSHAAEAITLTDELGVLIGWNEAAEKLTGIPAHQALGQYTWDIQLRLAPSEDRHPGYAERTAQKVKEVLLTGKGSILDKIATRFVTPDGRRYFVDQTIFAIPTTHGFRICTLAHDVTAAKEAQIALQAAHDELEQKVRERTAELQQTNLELEKALRAKDDFMAVMSHELRTPLTGVLGLAEALQMPHYGALTEKQRKAVMIIEQSGKRLLETVNDVLDFTMLQSEKISSNFQPCSIASLCRAALQSIKPLTDKKRQRTYFSALPEQITLQTDEQYFYKLLLHLLSNASKFTPEEGELGIAIVGEDLQVKVTVWDKGIGIRQQDLPRLFKPFVQLDTSLSRQYEGSGLGLALARQLALAIGGNIDVESVFGEGSRFIITLPWVH